MSVVALEDYRLLTQDSATPDDTVTASLDRAITSAEEFCKRIFGYGTYKETCYVYENSMVYPTVTPLESVVDAPGVNSIQGAAVWVGWWDPYPVLNVGGANASSAFPPQVTLTYTGGYADGELPERLLEAIVAIAWRRLHPTILSGLPAFVNSVHVGDSGFSATRPFGVAGSLTDAEAAMLQPYVSRPLRAWRMNLEKIA